MSWLRTRRVARIHRRSQKLAMAGDPAGAIAGFRRALGIDPDDAVSHIHLALALAEIGELEEAQSEARRAVALDPGESAVHLFAGRVHYDAGDFDAAAQAFDVVLAANPRNDLAHAYRILTDWASGDDSAPGRIHPEDLPDSTPFLVRWLERTEQVLRSTPDRPAPPKRRKPRFRPDQRRVVGFRPGRRGGTRCV